MKHCFKLLLLLLIPVLSQPIIAQNPIVTHRYLADPGAMVVDGCVYIYASNDDDNPIDQSGYFMETLVGISSCDLVNWTDHGVVLSVPDNFGWAANSWAPSPVYKDGTTYLYFANNATNIGVGVSDDPAGPFTDPIGAPLITGNTPGVLPADNIWLFDPMGFIDDDGQAYLYFGGNGENNLRIIELNDNMISTQGSATSFFVPGFFEAAWMHKNEDIYYFTYSTDTQNGLRIDYMTSDNPTTGFTYGGILSGQPPNNNNNNHHAVFELNGQWYQAYHNRIVAQQAGIPPTYRRNLNLDTFQHNPDGSIEQMDHTSEGVDQIGSLNPYERTEAETMNAQSGIETKRSEVVGMHLTDINNGDWIRVRGVDFGTTEPAAFTASIASDLKIGESSGGSIEIRLGSEDGTLIGTVPVSYTGGLDSWQSKTIAIDEVTGVQDVYFVFTGGEAPQLFNFDHWQFIEKTASQDLLAINASISKSKIDTLAGQNTGDITVNAIYTDGTSTDITSSAVLTFSDEEIISIEGNTVTGLDYGPVTITATFETFSDSVKVLVKNLDSELEVSRIFVEESEIGLFVGTTTTVAIMAEFVDGHLEDVTDSAMFSNPNPEIASISQNGIITGIAEGEVDILVSFQGEIGESKSTTLSVSVINGISVFMEAECGTLGENWRTISSNAASNGNYITVQPGIQSTESAPGSEGLLELNFELQAGGDYTVYGRINAPSFDDDSFWVSMNGGGFNLINGLANSGWEWLELGNYSLEQGSQSLRIGYREDGAQLDKIAVNNLGVAPTGMGEEASNVCEIVSNSEDKELPESFKLGQNYPNPFNPNTSIQYDISSPAFVKLEIVNSIGQKVATLVNARQTAGNYTIQFDASNLSSGVYFYTLTAGDFTQTKRMLLIK